MNLHFEILKKHLELLEGIVSLSEHNKPTYDDT
jgi:hypothetical protein